MYNRTCKNCNLFNCLFISYFISFHWWCFASKKYIKISMKVQISNSIKLCIYNCIYNFLFTFATTSASTRSVQTPTSPDHRKLRNDQGMKIKTKKITTRISMKWIEKKTHFITFFFLLLIIMTSRSRTQDFERNSQT